MDRIPGYEALLDGIDALTIKARLRRAFDAPTSFPDAKETRIYKREDLAAAWDEGWAKGRARGAGGGCKRSENPYREE